MLFRSDDYTEFVTRHLLTGLEDRVANMAAFTAGALRLFLEVLEAREERR